MASSYRLLLYGIVAFLMLLEFTNVFPELFYKGDQYELISDVDLPNDIKISLETNNKLFMPYPHINESLFKKLMSMKRLLPKTKHYQHVLEYNFTRPINNNCDYSGKVFIIGTQKTGTESLKDALSILGYKCSRISMWGKGSCNQDLLFYWYKYGVDITFTFVDDISFLFLNDEYAPLLLYLSEIASIFKDPPYNYLYWLFDIWYPNSKFILTLRHETYDYVNSLIKMVNKKSETVKLYYLNGNKTNNKFNEFLMEWNAQYVRSLDEYAMLNARLYELHNFKAIKYFSSRNRIGIDKDLLIFDLSKYSDPFVPLTKFLGCPHPNVSFPKKNQAKSFFPKYLYPVERYNKLDWRTFNFSSKWKHLYLLLYGYTRNNNYSSSVLFNELYDYYGSTCCRNRTYLSNLSDEMSIF